MARPSFATGRFRESLAARSTAPKASRGRCCSRAITALWTTATSSSRRQKPCGNSMILRFPTAAALLLLTLNAPASAQSLTRYVKYETAGRVAWGVVEGDTIRELQGNVFDGGAPGGRTLKLADVKLLAPAEAKKVIAAGLNYRSHIGEQAPAKYVGLFAKMPTSLVGHGADIVYPDDATNLHYEAEVCVADYNQLTLVGRHNGKVVQESTTDLLIFSIDSVVSYVSRYVTLEPGDVIFTGTPGTTQAMKPGDTYEVEIEGVGLLRNTVVAERR